MKLELSLNVLGFFLFVFLFVFFLGGGGGGQEHIFKKIVPGKFQEFCFKGNFHMEDIFESKVWQGNLLWNRKLRERESCDLENWEFWD